MDGHLVERSDALGELGAAAERVGPRAGVLALIAGESGIGKTSVVRAFVDDLPDTWRVLQGGCDDLITPRPLGALRDAARGGAGRLGAALADGSRDKVLEALLGELDDPARATLLVVEDVHWADEATLDVLRYVGRRAPSAHALVLLTYRTDEVGSHHPVQPLLGELARAGATRVELPRLTVAGVAALVAGRPVDPAALHATTGGNPFFVSEVLAAQGVAVPDTVVDAVLGRMQRLSPGARQALAALSVLPTSVDLDLAVELVGDLGDLAEPERHGMLEVEVSAVRFRHELARRAVEQSLSQVERLAAHRAALAALRRRTGTDPAVLAHHAVEAGDADTLVEVGPAAARAAARTAAHTQAIAHYAAVLGHEDRFDQASRAALLEEYAWELHHARRFAEGAAVAARAVGLREQLDDARALATALVTWSRVAWLAGQAEVAFTAVDRALELARAEDDVAGQALALTYTGAMQVMAGHFAEAATVLPAGRELAEQAGRRDLVALCLTYEGHALSDTGKPGAVATLERAVAVAGSAGNDETTARAYVNLAEGLQLALRLDELERVAAQGLALARDLDLAGPTYSLTCATAQLLTARGRWDDALALLLELDAVADDVGLLAWISGPLTGTLLARRGDPAAEQWLGPMLDPARLPDSRHYARGVAVAVTEWCWLAGRPEEAGSVVAATLSLPGPGASADYVELSRWLRRTSLAAPLPLPVTTPDPWRLGLAGDWRAAADAWAALDVPYECALELLEADQPDPVLQAVALLDRLGAKPGAAIGRQRLRDLGVTRIPRGPSEHTLANPAGLTARQLEVLALVAEGLTNAEIGTRLYLSTRTVDHHVSAVLAKLGVGTRQEAARAAHELERPTAAN